ncbi:MAG: PAS domain-containing methyl-accepting chemotaxis protein [Kordiimonadaceae bacterium]|nr:PAS domain-containing methyl-accepting chemotaxis protein [Kordiimonadaceae bacterium]MBO6567155.1 PAS domain-containing methyl-accepting chemotaxis protein [Kordiimonadaceae bacterium]MBO6963630.1 PAS domain-containing methyl-accepting chemotaxis protein [Kordiimonadaceae bacterium]
MFETLFGRDGQRDDERASAANKSPTKSKSAKTNEATSILDALDRSQAVIEFETDGTIITANKNFLGAMGYRYNEIIGKHHRMFVVPGYENTDEYKEFWRSLKEGIFQAAEYKRVGKGGKEVWIQASYNPVKDRLGNVIKVVKYATDITAQVLQNADYCGQIEAINKVQAVIEFELDGTIRHANQNFLDAVGYSLLEIKGNHHRMFVLPEYAQSEEYKSFWERLAAGNFEAGQYKRIGKGGKEIWIQASYNPIFDPDGNPFKVVKYATDITEQKLRNADYSGQIAAIGKSQAVIEFELDGTIINANENFTSTVGYSLDEIKGQHHRMFMDPDEAKTPAYQRFWEQLGQGQFDAGEYRRIGKDGKEIWIQASYNPIFDPDGRPFKVVKYASDITDQVKGRDEAKRVGAMVDTNLEKILNAVGDASHQASSASSASSETAQTVQAVAAAAEQFQASTQEIASSMESSRSDVSRAMDEAQTADKSAQQLSDAAGAMTNIVDVINDIAGQINLLALNATIESARAGEAGKGFAVVASEVKSLANQVANATTQISNEINGMQDISGDVVKRLDRIKGAVSSVEGSVTAVASAVEEQAATSREITSSMHEASTAVEDINASLGTISGAVNNANEFAREGTDLYRKIRA